jgi:Dolichyl-phosphate-mannose-protein mannosyltransferase
LGNSATAARLRVVPLAYVRVIPAWGWVGAVVGFSFAIRFAFARRMVAPWIMVDELIYSELAKSFAATGHFMVRDRPTGSYGFVYPLLISPAYRAFTDVPTAYTAAKAINALLMSLVAVPTYLLARRLLPFAAALLAAVLAVAVPSTLYAGTLMTENAFYPLFMVAALLLVLVLERPTVLRQLALLAVCGVAFATRAQALALLPALVTAPLLLAWWQHSGRRSLRRYVPMWGILGGGALLVLVVQVARGRSPKAVLGAYETVGNQHYAVGEIARWLAYHVEELDLYLGIAPFAALVVLAVLAFRLPRVAQAFVAASVSLVAWLVLEVSAFASLSTVRRVEERNMFYVAPLFLIALLVWIERGMPRPPRRVVPVAVVAALLPALLPYRSLLGVQVQSDTLGLLPWWWLQDHVVSLAHLWIATLAFGLIVAGAFLLVPARFALALPTIVLAFFLASLAPIENGRHGVRMASLGALFEGVTTGDRNWVDDVVGPHARVAFVWSGQAPAFSLWENEFFSRSVGPVYELAVPLGGGLPATPMTVDRADGSLRAHGRAVLADYALTDVSVPLAGVIIATDQRKGMVLLRVPGVLRETQFVSGRYPGDTWSGPRVRYSRLDCAGGTVVVQLESDRHLFKGPQTVTAHSAGSIVRTQISPAAPAASLAVPLQRGANGRCTASFTVAPTAIPALRIRGNKDTRRLGVHFVRFDYLPPQGAEGS